MSCQSAREQLTAYLDGELDGDRGSALRGHLRTCEPCRTIARDEAALRDGMRALPPLDPPSTLWAGVQARLAAAEMADADKPAWRRWLARWTRLVMRPRVGFAGLALVSAIAILTWRATQRRDHGEVAFHVPVLVVPHAPQPASLPASDVTADLAGDAARASADYAAATSELMSLAHEARSQWPEERKHAFDNRVVELRHAIDAAPEGRTRHGAYRTLIRYLQGAAVRDEVALASIGGRP